MNSDLHRVLRVLEGGARDSLTGIQDSCQISEGFGSSLTGFLLILEDLLRIIWDFLSLLFLDFVFFFLFFFFALPFIYFFASVHLSWHFSLRSF